jgi:maleate isomerase
MYGWRSRLGIMVPSVNTVMEPELNRLAPEGVSVHAARLRADGAFAPDTLLAMAEHTERAAEELAHAADVLAYACTSGSFVQGRGWDEDLVARIERVTRKPATTTSTAIVRALTALGLHTIAVATPYTLEVNERLAAFFEQHGFAVLGVKGLGVARERPDPRVRHAAAARRPAHGRAGVACSSRHAPFVVTSPASAVGARPRGC